MWHPDPPQGFSSSQGLVIIGRPMIPLYGAPQGIGAIIKKLLLDLCPGAVSAYSLRRLSSDYLGPAIRVKRTSNGDQLDIEFVDDKLDLDSLGAFVGASDGLVTILYDQSGNGFDLDAQTNDARLPKIIQTGGLVTSDGNEALDFDGTDDVIFSTNSMSSPTSHIFAFTMWAKTILANGGIGFNLNFPNSLPSNRCVVFAPFTDIRTLFDAGNASTERLDSVTPVTLGNIQHTFIETAGVNNQKYRRDGVTLGERTQGSATTPISKISLGDADDNLVPFAMLFQEFVFYDTDQLSKVAAIETNIGDYWNIPRLIFNEVYKDFGTTGTGNNIIYDDGIDTGPIIGESP